MIQKDLLAASPEVAQFLLGKIISHQVGPIKLQGRIVETEAYHETDEASHTYVGRTKRNEVMFNEAGHLYVYLSYGIHYCMNVVVAKAGEGAAVLIRALEPIAGLEKMRFLRSKKSSKKTFRDNELASGPGKACAAMNITLEDNGTFLLNKGPLQLLPGTEVKEHQIVTTTRIGISKAKEKLWRFYLKDNEHVSQVMK